MTIMDMIIDAIDEAGLHYIIYGDNVVQCETVSGELMYLKFDEEGKLLTIY